MIITTVQQLLIKSELRFWLDSKPTRGMWEVSNVENLSPVVASGLHNSSLRYFRIDSLSLKQRSD